MISTRSETALCGLIDAAKPARHAGPMARPPKGPLGGRPCQWPMGPGPHENGIGSKVANGTAQDQRSGLNRKGQVPWHLPYSCERPRGPWTRGTVVRNNQIMQIACGLDYTLEWLVANAYTNPAHCNSKIRTLLKKIGTSTRRKLARSCLIVTGLANRPDTAHVGPA